MFGAFGDFLLEVLAMKYLGLHKKALEFFEAVLLQVLVHQLSHPSLYQHTLEIWYFLGLFLFLFFYCSPLCHHFFILFRSAYLRIIAQFSRFLCFILHLSDSIIVYR